MPWGRLDDSLYDHPKVDALPPRLRNACVGLWVRAISWSNRYLTDGHVPTGRLEKLDGRTVEITALLTVGMFDQEPGGIVVHDFLAFNDSASDVRQMREQKREAGRAGGLRSGEARRQAPAGGEVQAHGQAETKHPLDVRLNSRPSPVPSRPNPVPSGGESRATDDRYEAPETEAVAWLARHGADLPESNGIRRKLIGLVERFGSNAVIGRFDRLADAGVLDGDTRGFVFGAEDALFPKPDMKALDREETADAERERFNRQVERTQREMARIRGPIEESLT